MKVNKIDAPTFYLVGVIFIHATYLQKNRSLLMNCFKVHDAKYFLNKYISSMGKHMGIGVRI